MRLNVTQSHRPIKNEFALIGTMGSGADGISQPYALSCQSLFLLMAEAGLVARKSRWRANTIDNYGAFMLVDSCGNLVVGGSHYDLSAEDVIEWCQHLAEETGA